LRKSAELEIMKVFIDQHGTVRVSRHGVYRHVLELRALAHSKVRQIDIEDSPMLGPNDQGLTFGHDEE